MRCRHLVGHDVENVGLLGARAEAGRCAVVDGIRMASSGARDGRVPIAISGR